MESVILPISYMKMACAILALIVKSGDFRVLAIKFLKGVFLMKKLAIALLALAMVLTTVLVPILADPEEPTVIGYSADRVEKVNVEDLVDIKNYDSENVAPGFKINDAEGLVKFSELVNGGEDFKGTYIYLTKDIDMTGVEDFKPIGKYDFEVTERYVKDDVKAPNGVRTASLLTAYPFAGVFNGHGHVIDNLVITVDSREILYIGFFGYIEGATITNLVLGDNCSITDVGYNDYGGVGGLCGKSSGSTFNNVYNGMDVTSASVHAGGFAGRGYVNAINCTNAGDMTAWNSAAGFVGFNEDGATTIENCRNTGDMVGGNTAGFVARLRKNITIKNAINNGTLTGDVVGSIGGLIDQVAGVRTFENCTNYGELKASKEGARVGDFYVKNATQKVNNVDVEIPEPTTTNCRNLFGVEVDTYVPLTFVCDPSAAEDIGNADVTAFVTTEAPYKPVIGINDNPDGTEIGYSSFRIQHVDTTKIWDIKNFAEAPNEYSYKITDVAGFKALDDQLYNYRKFADITIYLANDIDFSEAKDFEPISYDIENVKHVNGSPKYFFAGIIDGQGEAICNLQMHSTEKVQTFTKEQLNNRIDLYHKTENPKGVHVESNTKGPDGEVLYEFKEAMVCVGLFGITGKITIKNLIVDESCAFSYSGSAANQNVSTLIAKSTDSITIDNVWTRADLSGAKWISAVCSRPAGKYEVKNMTQSGNITGTYSVAGFFSFDGQGGTIENCRNVGNITRVGSGKDYANACAGFVARARGSVTIKNCINNGTITAITGSSAFLGTIAAADTLINCKNYGQLVATAEDGVTSATFAFQEEGTVTNDDGTVSKVLKGSLTSEDFQDLSPEKAQDPTLKYESYDIDFTVEEGNPDVAITTEATTARNPASKPPKTNESTTTADPNATTAPSVDDLVDDDEGCGSTVIGGVAVIMIVSGAALTLFKKKED